MKNTYLPNVKGRKSNVKMINEKQKIKYLILFFLLLLFPMTVFAKEDLTLTVDKKDLEVGDTITVRANIPSNLNTYGMMATLKYDENVFEKIDDSAFSVKETESVTYNKDTNKFGIINTNGKITGELFQIHLKVKEDANVGYTNIALTNISSSNGDEKTTFSSVSTKVSVTRDAKDGETLPTNKENKIVEDKVSVVTTVTNTPTIVAIIIIAVIVLGVIVFIIRNNKKRRDKKSLYYFIALEILLLILLSVLFLRNDKKKDVNNDGKKDYQDAEEIIKYLIDIEGAKEEKESDNISDNISIAMREPIITTTTNRTMKSGKVEKVPTVEEKVESTTNKNTDSGKFDVNNDGQVDIDDVGHSVEDTTKKTKVTLKGIKSEKEMYVQKGGITLQFTATITPSDLKITKAKICNKYYDVNYKDGVYSVVVDYKKAGIHDFVIHSVMLSNGEERSTNLKITKEILKEVPKINISRENEKYDDMNLIVDLEDLDHSLTSASIFIFEGEVTEDDIRGAQEGPGIFDQVDEDGNQVETDDFDKFNKVYEKSLKAEEFPFHVNMKEIGLNLGGKYTVFVFGEYDLDLDPENGKNEYKEEIIEDSPKTITIGNIEIKPIDNETIYLNKNSKYSFNFDILFEPEELKQGITEVVVDGEYKEVIPFEDGYTVDVKAISTPGRHTFHISEVVLSDGTHMLCDYELEYEVLKDKPTIENVVFHKSNDKVTFTLNDLDRAFYDGKIKITDNLGNEVLDEELDVSEKSFSFDVDFKEGNTYDVEITADYDLDHDTLNEVNDGSQTFEHNFKVFGVTLHQIDNKIQYVEKNSSSVLYNFNATIDPKSDNTKITKVIINGQEYSVTTNEDGSYSVNVEIPDSNVSGKKDLNIEKVIIDEDITSADEINEEVNAKLPLQVEVLKEKPTIEDLFIDESQGAPIVTFTLKDPENTLEDNIGNLVIIDGTTMKEKEYPISSKGKNTIDLEGISEGGNYRLDIRVNYDLDLDKNSADNKETDQSLLESPHELIIYTVDLTQIRKEESKYAPKNTAFEFFVSSNVSPIEEIKSFVLSDNTIVDAKKTDDGYSILMKPEETYGEKTYTVKNIILQNDIEINVQEPLKLNIEILKDMPYINKINMNNSNTILNYEFEDHDDAFIDGTVTIYHNNDKINEEKIEKEKKGTVEYSFLDGETYMVKVVGSYNLDSKKNDGENEATDEVMYDQSFIIGGAYNFKLTDATITDSLQQDEKPVIRFKSTNTREDIIKNANLTNDSNPEQYSVKKVSKDYYEIKLNDADMSLGRHSVTLDSVIMENGLKTFTNEKDYDVKKLTYTVLKEAPTIENLEVNNNKTDKSIQSKFKLKDESSSVNKLIVILVDTTGKIVSKKELSKEELKKGSIEVSLSYKDSTDGFYTVKVLADYELSDNYKYTNKILGEQEIFTTTEDDIYISKMYIEGNNLYPTKNQKNYKVVFEIHVGDSVKAIAPSKYGSSRNYNKVHSITINGLNYTFNQDGSSTPSDYKGSVILTIPNDAGVLTIKANRVQLGISGYYNMTRTDMYSVEEKSVTIDVLKDQPKIENLTIHDDYDKEEATFDFDVVLDKTEKDENFTEGKITLGNKSHDITAGHNNFTLNGIERDKNLDLVFSGSYDLDTDAIEEEKDKNVVKNGKLFSTKYGLYNSKAYENISIENGKEISEKGNHYFEKNEKIKLAFSISNIDAKLAATPEKVIIDKKEYPLTSTEDGYEVMLDGYNSSGEKEITVTEVVLGNGKKVTLTKPYTFTPEVLKDVPMMNDFNYELEEDKIKVNFDLSDFDNSLIGKAKVMITDENGETIYNGDYKENIEFKKSGNVLRYYVKVMASYDRDIDTTKNSTNYEGNSILLDEIISLEENNIELKDITDINLYKKESSGGEDSIVLKDTVSIDDMRENTNQYFVEIMMENLPTVRASIKSIVTDDNTLTLVLDYEYVTKEEGKTKTIRIDYGSIEGNIAKNLTHPKDAFETLLASLSKGESVVLTHDYDASSVDLAGDVYCDIEYSGTLDGNGYTIKNLKKQLFQKINGGTVKDLTLTNVELPYNTHGSLAFTTSNATIKNVLVDGFTKTNSVSQIGSLVGVADQKTLIEDCRVENLNLSGGGQQQVGGLVGSLDNGSIIRNSYAIGKIYNSWNFTGGLTGNANGIPTIENSYAKVDLSNAAISCGIGCSYVSRINSINNVSLSSNYRNGIVNNKNTFTNNYYLDLTGREDTEKDGLKRITQEGVTAEFFQNDAKFSSDHWSFKKVSFDQPPRLKIEDKTSDSLLDGYDEARETLYNNVRKLTPFYDDNKIVESGNKIQDALLMEQEIAHIVPVDSSGNIVTYLTTDNPKMINKIKVVFKNGEKQEYSVFYDKTYDMVATYKINELGLDYNYNHYVIDSNSQVVNNLTNYLKGLDYTNNLDTLTTNDDSRIYRDFYNETTKNELQDFVLKYLSNSNYTNTSNIDAINSYLEREVKKDQKIEKALYTYNYFRRFYDLDVEGMKLYDFVMFYMQGFDERLTPQKIVELYFGNSDGSNFNTNVTGKVYKDLLSSYTKLTRISNFLEFVVTHFSNQNMDDWTRSQFKGILEEIPVEANKNIQYTLWDHFSNEDDEYKGDSYAVYNYVLPILTLPETAAYIISAPAQFTIGAQRVYMGNPTDPVELANFKAKMKVYTDRITSYYNTAYSIIQNEKIFNDIHLYQVDKRSTKNENGTGVYNYPNSTQEPFHKNFDEVVNVWPAEYGVNAGNWGDRIEWNVAGFMDSNIRNDGKTDEGHPTWCTWSHETAHYLDDRLFLEDYDRRYDAGGEDYADEFLMQKFGLKGIVMNLSIKYNKDSEVATNLTPERISSKTKVHDFYNKMFESFYAIDYIEAQAFLKLTKEQQKALGVQISYPNENKKFATIDGKSHDFNKEPNMFTGATYKEDQYAKFRARHTTQYTPLSKVEEDVTLNTIDDLIDKRIMLYTNITDTTSRGDNSYGGEGFDIVHWYQPNNPDGRPDSYSLKWLSYEMLGYAGYDQGFVEYASNINYETRQVYTSLVKPRDDNGNPILSNVKFKSDDMAITRISGGKYTTIDQYKKDRFKQTGEKLKHLKFINVDAYAQKMYDALVEDATKQDRGYTKSFNVRKEMYYMLKNKTNDFEEEIYSDAINQTINFDIKTQKEEG